MTIQEMNYKRYKETIKTMPAPISMNSVPRAYCDARGMIEYAKKKGVSTMELSLDERMKFYHPIG